MQHIRFSLNTSREFVRRLSACRLRRGLLALVLLPAVASSAGTGSTSEVGTLHYSGDYNGKVTFRDSDCIVMDGRLVSFNAPHWKDGVPEPQGTQIGMTLEKPEVPTEFNFQIDDGAAQNVFATTNQTRPIEGIQVRRAGGKWAIEFDGFRIAGTNWLQQMDPSKKKWVTLKGVLHCTNMQ
ncbi:hypothetical protein [Marinobacter sp. NFXS9]|uniref:hypothetical protein n=1 Tax=Marinobacter sp. NFXS9 TaxID=2818433 RepID=UPI0032E02A2D